MDTLPSKFGRFASVLLIALLVVTVTLPAAAHVYASVSERHAKTVGRPHHLDEAVPYQCCVGPTRTKI